MNITYSMHVNDNLCHLAVRGSAEIETVLKAACACACLRRIRICSQLFHRANKKLNKHLSSIILKRIIFNYHLKINKHPVLKTVRGKYYYVIWVLKRSKLGMFLTTNGHLKILR